MKFKYLVIRLSVFAAFLCGDVFAQSLNLSIHGGFSSNSLMRFARLDGGAGYAGKGSWHSGISIASRINDRFMISGEIVYAQHLIEITPEYFPNVEIVSENTNVRLLSLPIDIRWNFLKHIFIETGPSVDFDISDGTNPIDSQSGIGWNAGIRAGIDYRKLCFTIKPSIKLHSLIAFNRENHHLHLFETGLTFGIGYLF